MNAFPKAIHKIFKCKNRYVKKLRTKQINYVILSVSHICTNEHISLQNYKNENKKNEKYLISVYAVTIWQKKSYYLFDEKNI
jgi:hypothetical protein